VCDEGGSVPLLIKDNDASLMELAQSLRFGAARHADTLKVLVGQADRILPTFQNLPIDFDQHSPSRRPDASIKFQAARVRNASEALFGAAQAGALISRESLVDLRASTSKSSDIANHFLRLRKSVE
jgi:hypothetical protein